MARALLAAFATTALIAASASVAEPALASRHHHSGGRGIVVWTHRAAPDSEHLMVARATGATSGR